MNWYSFAGIYDCHKSKKTSTTYKFLPAEVGSHHVGWPCSSKWIFEKPHPMADPLRGSGETRFSSVLQEVTSYKLHYSESVGGLLWDPVAQGGGSKEGLRKVFLMTGAKWAHFTSWGNPVCFLVFWSLRPDWW